LHVLAVTGGVRVGPKEGRVIHFGRNRPEAHVCIGENDRKVSRQHGTFTRDAGHWWVRTTGRLPVRLLSMRDEPIPVSRVRTRMSRGGVAGLTREEVGEPVGNTLNHNLIRELTESTTLVPPDLRLAGLED
jgi:pSer/pThr/pTyr-binding forkhead associated (FHA) protein